MTPSTNAHPRVASSTVEIDPEIVIAVTGPADENLRVVENSTEADILARGNYITIRGEASEVSRARRAIEELITLVERGNSVDADATRRIMRIVEEGERNLVQPQGPQEAIVTYRGKSVRAKTLGQREYVDAIDANTVVFGVGPAGTGKTYLAMAKAVQALMRKDVSRIILTRPAVEAGEKLGFLPGTLNDKIDPYLRPLHDALREMVDPDTIPRMMETGIVEVAPLAYMRGRTLNDSFVILDEAQNTTPAQMKMFLTRLGFNTKMVITGDMTQMDLPNQQESGLKVAQSILREVPGVHVAMFDSDDVVRHRLVSRIVDAYDSYEAEAWLREENHDHRGAKTAPRSAAQPVKPQKTAGRPKVFNKHVYREGDK